MTAPETFRLASSLPEPYLHQRRQMVRAGEILFLEGDAADGVFYLEEGRLRLTKRVRSTTRTLSLLRSGALIGEGAIAGEVVRQATAIALTDLVLYHFSSEEFRALLLQHPALSTRFFEQVARRLRDAEDQIELMMLSDSPSKVVGALLKLARDHLGPDHTLANSRSDLPVAVPVTLAISPVDLSSRIGLEIDAVKRAVLRLREQDYLRVQGDAIHILDVDALTRLFLLLGSREDLRADGVTR